MIETGTDPKLSDDADEVMTEAEIKEYIKEKAKYIGMSWWGDSESNASDWNSEFMKKCEKDE